MKNNYKPWSVEDLKKLKELYPKHEAKELVDVFGRSLKAIYSATKKYKMKSGRDGRFKKGHIAHNKGKKQIEFMTPDGIERTIPTRFKKGCIPHNKNPLGSERINFDGYIEIKTKEPDLYELKHRIIWREKFGQIPPSHNIQFKDGNRQNLDIDNLYMISRADQLKYANSIHNYPHEICETIRTLGLLSRQINKQLKSQKHG